jgi:hypothetical protein
MHPISTKEKNNIGTSKLINDEHYQMLPQRAARNENWAAYFLLVNACYNIAKDRPLTQMACHAAG